ncbi:uncharacterized protein TNCV_3712081 [Trichonephila clavipes]|uniref:RNase H type-1 domain-containing protein n=1 Tax=Trichonephila clavipes TaxID=2585209 RepID=A0A8X6URM4_TRICX|nr:uncharacterized protein TNCV_3712081 [Trichonephila clavipes]
MISRLNISLQFLASLEVDPELPWNILWTDEAHFHLDGLVNTHNCRIWETDNPHSTLQVPLHSPKVTVLVHHEEACYVTPQRSPSRIPTAVNIASKNVNSATLGAVLGFTGYHPTVFQWVPSHCGLWGNERADFLAKKGTGILQNFRRDLTLHSAKLEIKRIFRESFRLTASRVARV